MFTSKMSYIYVVIQFIIWSVPWLTNAELLCCPVCISVMGLGGVTVRCGYVEKKVPVIICTSFLLTVNLLCCLYI
jgi:hypothetical protein